MAEERVGDGLQHALHAHHAEPFAVRGDSLGDACRLRDASVLRQHRLAGLLDLQQQRILVGALQQLQVAPRADAADADDPSREIGRLVLREHGVDVDADGVAVLGEQGVDRLRALRAGDGIGLVEVEPHHGRRVLHEAELAVGLALGRAADRARRRAALGGGEGGIEHSRPSRLSWRRADSTFRCMK